MAPCPGAANLCCLFIQDEPSPPETLGVLAFDAAKTMCRLLSLYNSLTPQEIVHLRRNIIRSKSVSSLNSRDECFLLTLACAERLEDLNLAAATVSRLAARCSDQNLARFEALDARKLEFGTREVEKKIESMEKLVFATRSLHKAMECLTEMEASEKKMQRWRNIRATNGLKVKVECFNERITFYRRQIMYFKQVSLWGQTFDKVVGLMARIVCIVYNRICTVFRIFITGNVARGINHKRRNNNRPRVARSPENCCCRVEHRDLYRMNLFLFEQTEEQLLIRKRVWGCCQVQKTTSTGVFRYHHSPPQGGAEAARNNRVMRLAPATTVGGAGLSLRYANVIMLAERCLNAPDATIGDDARAALYEMLPGRLETKLRQKLKEEWLEWRKLKGDGDGKSAAVRRWHDEVAEVMEWLVPVAHDMVRWQTERNMEKQKFETRPTVLLLQTLHYSDLEKVEEAIVKVAIWIRLGGDGFVFADDAKTLGGATPDGNGTASRNVVAGGGRRENLELRCRRRTGFSGFLILQVSLVREASCDEDGDSFGCILRRGGSCLAMVVVRRRP
ncbi:uncharacterized protein LOC106758233 [Vigna radiata var. radiata]|uniref:Uncharacterized protein LOC106758233 n=1 Tax=Vigna radiata var. radiata TaxID=3916 RepID=A0A1S3TSF9_VIGRR|nr:uncharacterized protein LOC106758233 [Vigna radiata var. radiata]